MKIDMLFITYNRLPYARISLPALLGDPSEEFKLTIWDNGSTDGTREFLESIEDPRISRRVFATQNVRLHGAINDVVQNSSADLLGVVLDDLCVTAGWTRPLALAHADIPKLGMIGCWHFVPEPLDCERAKHKIVTLGCHRILRHPWGGVPYIIKISTMREFGPLSSSRTTYYWIAMAQKGYINGHYVPALPAEHMDYPWAEHFAYKGRFDEWLAISSGARAHGIRTLEDAREWHQVVLSNVMDDPWDVKYYVGWRGKLYRGKQKLRRMLTGSRF